MAANVSHLQHNVNQSIIDFCAFDKIESMGHEHINTATPSIQENMMQSSRNESAQNDADLVLNCEREMRNDAFIDNTNDENEIINRDYNIQN